MHNNSHLHLVSESMMAYVIILMIIFIMNSKALRSLCSGDMFSGNSGINNFKILQFNSACALLFSRRDNLAVFHVNRRLQREGTAAPIKSDVSSDFPSVFC